MHLQNFCHFHFYFITMPSAFRATGLSRPSTFHAAGLSLGCLRLFSTARSYLAFGFPHNRTFLPSAFCAQEDFSGFSFCTIGLFAFGFTHDRTFRLRLYAAVQCNASDAKSCHMSLMNAIAMSKERRVGLIINGHPLGESPCYLIEIP